MIKADCDRLNDSEFSHWKGRPPVLSNDRTSAEVAIGIDAEIDHDGGTDDEQNVHQSGVL